VRENRERRRGGICFSLNLIKGGYTTVDNEEKGSFGLQRKRRKKKKKISNEPREGGGEKRMDKFEEGVIPERGEK